LQWSRGDPRSDKTPRAIEDVARSFTPAPTPQGEVSFVEVQFSGVSALAAYI
jgi:hypothetical protein